MKIALMNKTIQKKASASCSVMEYPFNHDMLNIAICPYKHLFFAHQYLGKSEACNHQDP